MIKYSIVIASVPDREELVAEIWIENELFAEIEQDNNCLTIHIYPTKEFDLDYYDFIKMIEKAKEKLLE